MPKLCIHLFLWGILLQPTGRLMAQLPSWLPSDGLVAWWPFCGNANDESGNGYHGIVSDATLIPDRYNYSNSAFSFDGINDQIIVKDFCSFVPESAISVSVWVYGNAAKTQSLFQISNNSQTNRILVHLHWITAQNSYWDFGSIFDGGRLHCQIAASNFGQWEHYVFVAETASNKMEIYRNGVLVCSMYNANTFFQQTLSDFWIGGGQVPNNVAFFNGRIDDMGIWNRVLTYQEIQDLYTADPYFPCFPIVDLDEDNNAGVPPIHWQDSVCNETIWAICDEDVHITRQYGIDSMVVKLDQSPDLPLEFFDAMALDSIGVGGIGSQQIVFYPILGEPSATAWKGALKKVRLIHSGGSPSSGVRHISVQAWLYGIKSELATTEIHVNPPIGVELLDTVIYVCEADELLNLNELVSLPDSIKGIWLPETFHGGNQYHPVFDGNGTWYFVSAEVNPECKIDSIVLHVEVVPVIIPFLEDAYWICPGEELLLSVEDTFANYYWNGVPGNSDHLVTNMGAISLVVEDVYGCRGEKLSYVHQFPIPDTTSEHHFICAPGSLVIGQDTFTDSGLYPYFYDDPNGCDSVHIIYFTVLPSPEITINGHDFICGDKSTLLTVSPNHEILWSSGETGSSIEVDEPGWYGVMVRDSNNCHSNDSIFINQSEDLELKWEGLNPICPGDSNGLIQLLAINSGTFPIKLLDPAILLHDNFSMSGLSGGSYQLVSEDSVGCRDTAIIVLESSEALWLMVEDPVILLEHEQVTIQAQTNAIMPWSWQWYPIEGLDITSSGRFTISSATSVVYSITLTDAKGCTLVYPLSVIVKPDLRLYIPNSFSPNNDGINDHWIPFSKIGSTYLILQLRIYDRWGGLLIETSGISGEVGWDGMVNGKRCDPGVFVYTLDVQLSDGSTVLLSGDIQVAY